MNNKYILAVVSFLAGILTGGLGIYITKINKYDKDFKKKLKEMDEYYTNNKKTTKPATNTNKETPKFTEPERKDMMEEARKIVSREGYKKHYGKILLDDLDDEEDDEEPDEPPIPDETGSPNPYLIEPNQFGDQEMYEMETWSLYLDGMVTNEEDLPMGVDSIENYISTEAIDQLKSSEDDSVFVRNERLKTDYQIIKVMRRYADD